MSSCDVWQPESPETDQSDDCWSAEPEFSIHVYASSATDERYTYFHNFTAPCHLLTDRRTSWNYLWIILSNLGVPNQDQPSMIQKISTCAREMADDPDNMYLKTIPMVVSLKVGQELVLESELPEFPDHVIRFVPTRKSAIQGMLERVEIQGCDQQCMVCLDEIPKGSEAACMPCSHVYHESCIVNWLDKSNLCPLCRFEMPAEYA
ncbi:hypothetical protein M0R45_023234 [Rubus argutus]|uniref:RING-type E3 ubiquitin transferase n=1 Tax=Rubus argutus TaxID=59490 RepID=A0AAW1WQS9_RUBAR